MKRITDSEIIEEYRLRQSEAEKQKAELEAKLRLFDENIKYLTGKSINQNGVTPPANSEAPKKNKTWKELIDIGLIKQDCTIDELVEIAKPYRTDLTETQIKHNIIANVGKLVKNKSDIYSFRNIATTPKGKLYKYTKKKP